MYSDEISVGKAEDLRGRKFNKLTVLYRVKNNGKNAKWKCRCECGNITEVLGKDLKNNHIKSCGCIQGGKLRDINGQIFGKLKVLERAENDKNGRAIWKCQCECGTVFNVRGDYLRTGHTRSCGCDTSSLGELSIEHLLIENHLPFVREKTFDTCRFTDTNYLARFDFYVNNSYIIEFDGEQHFKPIDWFGGDERLRIRQEKDIFKNNWCKENNIPLIRIPFFHLKYLSLDDLLLETTQFRYL